MFDIVCPVSEVEGIIDFLCHFDKMMTVTHFASCRPAARNLKHLVPRRKETPPNVMRSPQCLPQASRILLARALVNTLPLPIHLYRRRNRFVICRKRVAGADDCSNGLEGDFPDTGVFVGKSVAEAKTGGPVRGTHRHELSQCANQLETLGTTLKEPDCHVLGHSIAVHANPDLTGLPGA